MNIKILGGGCSSCKKLYENTLKVVAKNNISADVEYITDMPTVMKYGVMQMPALVIDEKVVSQGKVLKPIEISKLFD